MSRKLQNKPHLEDRRRTSTTSSLLIAFMILVGLGATLAPGTYWWQLRDRLRVAENNRDYVSRMIEKSKKQFFVGGPDEQDLERYEREIGQAERALEIARKLLLPAFLFGGLLLLAAAFLVVKANARCVTARDKYRHDLDGAISGKP